MSVLFYIAIYIAVGFVSAVVVSRVAMKERGYPIHDFDDLDDDEQSLVIFSFVAWPIVIIVFAVAIVCGLAVIIANRKDDSK